MKERVFLLLLSCSVCILAEQDFFRLLVLPLINYLCLLCLSFLHHVLIFYHTAATILIFKVLCFLAPLYLSLLLCQLP